ncbi:MAG: IclR family transcriptional regulator [Betaproteobacteria bacterium]
MKSGELPVVKSADRVLDVLELLARQGQPMSHTEIAAALGIPKSSLTQLLRNLCARQYIASPPGAQAFAIGPAVFTLAQRGRRGRDLAAIAQPLVEQITRETDESSSLNLLREGEIERACGADSPQALTYSMKLGSRAPVHAVSSGKAILAFLPPQQRDRCLSKVSFERVTPRTIVSMRRLMSVLRQVAAEGVAYSFEEFTPGIVGVAVPVLDQQGHAAGALNVAIPSVRYDEALRLRAIKSLRQARRALEAELRD